MPIEGELLVRIESRDGRVTAASARAERPRVARRLFLGRPGREAAPICRSLFSVCGRSQAIAAQGAVEAIEGRESNRVQIRARRICAETLQEHAWRLLVDLPRLAGREPAIDVVAEERKALAELLDADRDIDVAPIVDTLHAWSGRVLFGWEPQRFLEIETLSDLARWTREAGTPAAALCREMLDGAPAIGASDVPLLPPAAEGWIGNDLAAAIDGDEAFDERPQVDGAARETGPLARNASQPLVAAAIAAWGRGVGARVLARLVEVARLLVALPGELPRLHGAIRTGPGKGIGWAETARGLLLHAVTLDDERIAGYRIVAPTEWNFHPDGAFARGARSIGAGAPRELDARVRLLVASLDPCVEVRYEASHA
jgi:uptake hydrogenase large subunit